MLKQIKQQIKLKIKRLPSKPNAMKTTFLIVAVIVVGSLTSCGSHCQSDKWRKKRFVKLEQPVPVASQQQVIC